MTGIIDYGMGNLRSVVNALEYIGEKYIVTDDTAALDGCSRLLLPGVGAFPDAARRLAESGLSDYILSAAKENRPLLGICLGMQLLFEQSCEFEKTAGLGIIGGEVIKIEPGEKEGRLKIPHMGWNSLSHTQPSPLTEGVAEGSCVYFVHSYKAVVSDRSSLCSVTRYGGEITAAVSRGMVFGTQFHPEKSGETGLKILRNFIGL